MGKLMQDISTAELMEMRSQGMTWDDMADNLGVSKSTVIRYTPHDRGKTAPKGVDKAEVLRLYDEGMSYTEIAKRMHISVTTVRFHCMKGHKADFSERRKAVEAKYAPHEEQEATPVVKRESVQDAGQNILNGFVLAKTVEIGTAKRKYIVRMDRDECTITLHTESGEITLCMDDLQDIANECKAVFNYVQSHSTLALEVI